MNEHVDSVKTYTVVWLILLALTAITTTVAYVDLGAFSVVVALLIAAIKMLLVALFFMHMRYSTKLTRLAAAGAFLWLFIMMAFTLADVWTRGLVGTLGR
ncbi:MAG TPA: cytochrome C oxidase subunit IV family protein [Bryobacteraceae bacterium]|jgi:cytochrome c oxidase subunit 4